MYFFFQIHIIYYRNENLVPVEMYLNMLTEVISNRIFINDYNRIHPLESDMDIINEICPVM